MDLVLVINKYLADKQHLVTENDSLNIVDNTIHSWNFANIPHPSQEELETLQPQVDAQQSQDQINAEALAFLASTDWMVVRAMERGEELSPEFKVERQAARDRIVK